MGHETNIESKRDKVEGLVECQSCDEVFLTSIESIPSGFASSAFCGSCQKEDPVVVYTYKPSGMKI
jgi:hypothetical protein